MRYHAVKKSQNQSVLNLDQILIINNSSRSISFSLVYKWVITMMFNYNMVGLRFQGAVEAPGVSRLLEISRQPHYGVRERLPPLTASLLGHHARSIGS